MENSRIHVGRMPVRIPFLVQGEAPQMEAGNVYLNQVVQEQAQVEQELRRNAPGTAPGPATQSVGAERSPGEPAATLNYRITGFWRWKTVVVPPNMHVVHTRRGHP